MCSMLARAHHGVLVSHFMLAQFFIVDLLAVSHHFLRPRPVELPVISQSEATSDDDQPVRLDSVPDSFLLAPSVGLGLLSAVVHA